MRSTALLLVAAALLAAPIAAAADPIEQPKYADWFTDEALRVDLVHSGTRGEQSFAIEELVAEPIWPGTRVHLVDPTGFGEYHFRVLDQATGREIFSQGYCSLFGEWLTTDAAGRGERRAMNEPVRMPRPKRPVQLVLEARDGKGGFEELQKLAIDPDAYDVRRGRRGALPLASIHRGDADPAKTIDIVVVPDGYAADEIDKMRADARRFAGVILDHAPFSAHRDSISIRLVEAISRESGADEPGKGAFRDTAVHTAFDTFDAERYLTTWDMKALREVASFAPYDTIVVMVNACRYGGGGVFGAFSIFSADSEYADYVLVHEFGHGFGALGDEYFSSATGIDEDEMYAAGVEPWEPNITAATARDEIKWRALIAPETPVPTPDTAEYDGVVGLFEGAGYKSKGLYRPTRDSKMHHKGLLPFGPVNEAALERMIRYFTGEEVAP
ncbi:MAG: IgA Peptidase M64 [Proteobacteria bacterium]|jgi:hypothetical protein|nr:IgA Peptidase M64 [Pseudomonadota bacterium]